MNPEDAWGTFKTDKTSGRIVSVHISNQGRFESPYTRDKRQVFAWLTSTNVQRLADLRSHSPICESAETNSRDMLDMRQVLQVA